MPGAVTNRSYRVLMPENFLKNGKLNALEIRRSGEGSHKGSPYTDASGIGVFLLGRFPLLQKSLFLIWRLIVLPKHFIGKTSAVLNDPCGEIKRNLGNVVFLRALFNPGLRDISHKPSRH